MKLFLNRLLFAGGCIVLFILWNLSVFGQEQLPVRFSRLNTANGLSQSTVTAILKDHYGLMWFGTMDGLNKYDGYQFKVYRHQPTDQKSLPNNQIKALFEDKEGNLWIGTMAGGLVKYNRDEDSFIQIMLPQKENPVQNISVNTIFEDHRGNLWIGTYANLYRFDKNTCRPQEYRFSFPDVPQNDPVVITALLEDRQQHLWIGTKNGLYVFDPMHQTYKRFSYQPEKSGVISDNRINCLALDEKGNLWIGTNGGLNYFDCEQQRFTTYTHRDGETSSLFNNVVTAISKGPEGKWWIGTEESLDLLDARTGLFTHHQNNITDEESLSHNSIYSLLMDPQGILWVGTYAGGLNKYDMNHTYFQYYKSSHFTYGTSNSVVTSFAEAENGDIWIGTDGGSLNLWKRKTNTFVSFNPTAKGGFGSYSALSLLMSKNKKNLWVGTYGKGLKRLDLIKHTFTHYHMKGERNSEISNNSIYALLEDRYGQIWMGTNGDGVNVLQPDKGKVVKFRANGSRDNLANNYIRAFYEDSEGNIWIGTYSGGISIYHPATKSFSTLNKANSNLQSDVVYAIYGDSKGRIWVGTMEGGLNCYHPDTRTFTALTVSDGLPSNIINSLFEDRQGQLWISTNNGVSRFDPDQKAFINYGTYNGLQGTEFLPGAGLKTAEGQILFGGINGFNVLHEQRIALNPHAPPVVFTDFQLFNKPVQIGGKDSPLQKHIDNTPAITLRYDQSVFTIEFAALNYTIPEKNSYAYKLEGFDKEWNQVGNNRRATYTNLDPGEYVFQVMAANNDGIWNKHGATLKITVTPPIWKTKTAYLLYFCMVMGILYGLYREIRSREKLKNEIRFERLAARKNEELNQAKANFFTGISHELRTPLSLILDPLRKIIAAENSLSQIQGYGKLAYKHAERLLLLVNQLLDFRRLEAGHVILHIRRVELVQWIKGITESFQEHALSRKILFSVECPADSLFAAVDPDKLEKVLSNLLSNAFKFTPEGGKIDIRLQTYTEEALPDSTKWVAIHVKDNGIGIPEQAKEKIFELFYQVEGISPFENTSTGIGLALVKELVQLHKGKLRVESEWGHGADFVVCLPLVEEQQADTVQITEKIMPPVNAMENVLKKEDDYEEKPIVVATTGTGTKPLVLLIEDNEDLRKYIVAELEASYDMLEAPNGFVGFEKAVAHIPDLIISDIMMPGVDGLSCCQQLKHDERTSHIPVILLTAKQTDANKIEGYNCGADAYIAKPFSVDLLHARVANLLESRKKLRILFEGKTKEILTAPHIGIHDKVFLEKAKTAIEKNCIDPQFNVDKLAEEVNMSRRQLYRKLKALTNQSVQDFITGVCLEKAADLLLSGAYTIAEVGYQVGFSEPSNFSRAFGKHYGMSPKSYLQKKMGYAAK